jgi:hypothetical protein
MQKHAFFTEHAETVIEELSAFSGFSGTSLFMCSMGEYAFFTEFTES